MIANYFIVTYKLFFLRIDRSPAQSMRERAALADLTFPLLLLKKDHGKQVKMIMAQNPILSLTYSCILTINKRLI